MSRSDLRCAGSIPAAALPRRELLQRFGMGLGAFALAEIMGPGRAAAAQATPAIPHFPPRAKRVIYLFQSGGPSQMDLFDYKPLLNERNGEELPDSVRKGQRLTAMSSNQVSFPLAGSAFRFAQYGESGAWFSELLPYTASIADELCIVKSLHTDAINHDPAITFLQTGSQVSGRPSMGSWLSYGLGSENSDLPAYMVLLTKGKGGQPLYSRLWGSGFLASSHQGLRLRPGENPVLHLKNPDGVSRKSRRALLDRLEELQALSLEGHGEAAIENRISQYELAYRMQASVPEMADVSAEPDSVFDEYGPDSRTPGSYAANCILARRMAERGVRFVQLYHRGWDQHGDLPKNIATQCRETDQPSAALVMDLKRRGMLDDTLVIWGGEFGRTNYSQGKLTETNYGRDHHPRCFTVWMAGGGVRPGMTFGATDEFGYNIVSNPVDVHDFHATILKLLGIDHERLTYKFQGRRYRLTDVHGKVIQSILS